MQELRNRDALLCCTGKKFFYDTIQMILLSKDVHWTCMD